MEGTQKELSCFRKCTTQNEEEANCAQLDRNWVNRQNAEASKNLFSRSTSLDLLPLDWIKGGHAGHNYRNHGKNGAAGHHTK